MHERLIEGWLDSASERGYQSPFCQMLLGQGHHVLHSTRHGSLEFGKDVVTLDSSGRPCAYQLKAHPGGRLTKSGFAAMNDQIMELVTLPIACPGAPKQRHKAFLVTNGEVAEEVYVAIDALNEQIRRQRYAALKLEVLRRGDLLKMAKELGTSLWPWELGDIDRLLALLVSDGRGQLDCRGLHGLLTQILLLERRGPRAGSAADVRRRIAAAALLTSVSLRNYHTSENHAAVVTAWTMFSTYAIAACHRKGVSFDKSAKGPVDVALATIRDHLTDLALEVSARDTPLGEPSLAEGLVYRSRLTLLASLLSILWFWQENEGQTSEDVRTKIGSFVTKHVQNLQLWGEGAIPQWLTVGWCLRSLDASLSPDIFFIRLLNTVIQCARERGGLTLAAPYFDYETVVRHQLAEAIPLGEDPLKDEQEGGATYFGEVLLHLVACKNLKQVCKSVWYDFSKIGIREFKPSTEWEYCMWRAVDGRNELRIPSPTKQWDELVKEAAECEGVGIPAELRARPHLLSLFIVFFPHRATGSAIRYLASVFDRSWYHPRDVTN